MGRVSQALVALLTVGVLVTVTGCTRAEQRDAGSPDDPGPVPFADCADLTQAPTGSTGTGDQPTGDPTGGKLPALQLPCFAGGPDVPLAELRGPVVMTLWASWCGPCREELPAFQRLSERAGDRVRVVGVNVRDRKEGARSLAEDLGLHFPTLVDADDRLPRALGRPVLPLTLFVDGSGRVQHLDASGTLDDGSLTELVERTLNVTVPQ